MEPVNEYRQGSVVGRARSRTKQILASLVLCRRMIGFYREVRTLSIFFPFSHSFSFAFRAFSTLLELNLTFIQHWNNQSRQNCRFFHFLSRLSGFFCFFQSQKPLSCFFRYSQSTFADKPKILQSNQFPSQFWEFLHIFSGTSKLQQFFILESRNPSSCFFRFKKNSVNFIMLKFFFFHFLKTKTSGRWIYPVAVSIFEDETNFHSSRKGLQMFLCHK